MLYDDLQLGDPVPFKDKEVTQIHWAAGEVSHEMAADDSFPALLMDGKGLDRIGVLCGRIRHPLPDGIAARICIALIHDDGVLREAFGNRLCIAFFVRGEICGDRGWEVD